MCRERVVVAFNGWRIRLSVARLRFPVWLRNQGDYDCLWLTAWGQGRGGDVAASPRDRKSSLCIGVNIVGTDGSGLSYAGDSGLYPGRGILARRVERKA